MSFELVLTVSLIGGKVGTSVNCRNRSQRVICAEYHLDRILSYITRDMRYDSNGFDTWDARDDIS